MAPTGKKLFDKDLVNPIHNIPQETVQEKGDIFLIGRVPIQNWIFIGKKPFEIRSLKYIASGLKGVGQSKTTKKK